MVALDVPRRLALRRPRVGRRIDHHEVERRLAAECPVLEKGAGLIPHDPVAARVLEAILREVRPRPLEVGV